MTGVAMAHRGGGPCISVIGVGDVYRSDDAFGPYVIEVAKATHAFPPGVRLLSVGTAPAELYPFVARSDALIVVEVARSDRPPGSFLTRRLEPVEARPPRRRADPFHPSLDEALLLAQLTGRTPRSVYWIGVAPRYLTPGIGLSEAARGVVPVAAGEVVLELARLGVLAVPRLRSHAPDIWWEQDALPASPRASAASPPPAPARRGRRVPAMEDTPRPRPSPAPTRSRLGVS